MSSSSQAPARGRARGRRSRAAADDGRPPVPRAAWTRLAACTAAAALLQLDGTLITVALPKLADGLHVSGSSTSVVLSAYFGAYALLLIPGGELVDRLGARRLALWGLALFAIGAIGGALSQTFTELIIARVVQGAGAGLVSPAALAGAVSGFPPERRGAALGIWGASAGTSNLIGPLLGGLLTVTLGWRADWWALVPLAVAAAIGVARAVPASVAPAHDAAQGVGSGAAVPGANRIVAAGAHEAVPGANRIVAAGAHEGVPGANRIVAAATLIAALTFAVMIGAFYIAEQYLQRTAHFSALGASSALVIVALLVGGAAPLAGRLVDSRGERPATVLGFLGAGGGLIVLGLPGMPLANLLTILPLIPVGLGLGMLFVPVSRAALNATPDASHGRTSALLSAGRLLGAAVGAGLAGVALSSALTAPVVHHTLLVGAGICLVIGLPGAFCLRASETTGAAPAAA